VRLACREPIPRSSFDMKAELSRTEFGHELDGEGTGLRFRAFVISNRILSSNGRFPVRYLLRLFIPTMDLHEGAGLYEHRQP
jgi:hypothetical protein